ncbi:expressed unknown protein [Seminavis robusta]|uniref:Uncharacterized protein n=1 Tax=Seminavis robusta TaxID=568900 RepID=A0A9N8HKZ5_9STRA|nr:expressed unknown protein [Seminavis robusta]|eukprot:Sro986_g228090.1 n/a (454) ;mRNA; r:12714-14264
MMQSAQRSGKWTEEEEEFAQELMDAFHSGHLDVEEGVSLRKLLAKKLMCSAKRVSKKFEGTNYKGKMQYARDYDIPEKDVQERKAKLDVLEKCFLESIREIEAQEASRRATMSRSLPFATGNRLPGSSSSLNNNTVAFPSAASFGSAAGMATGNSAGSMGSSSDSASFAHLRQAILNQSSHLPPTNAGWAEAASALSAASGVLPSLSRASALFGRESLAQPFSANMGRRDSSRDSLAALQTSLGRQDSVPSVSSAASTNREERLAELMLSGGNRFLGGTDVHPNSMAAAAAAARASLTSSLLPGGRADPMLNGAPGFASMPGRDHLQAALSRTSSFANNTAAMDFRLQMAQADMLGSSQPAAAAAGLSRTQAEILARNPELAYLQRVSMLERQEVALRRRASSISQGGGAQTAQGILEQQLAGKRSRGDAPSEEKDDFVLQRMAKRGNYGQEP